MRVMLDRGAREIDGVSGRRYYAKDGVFNMAPEDARALVKIGGAPCTTAGVARSKGYKCPECGFAAWFRKCSRCGAETVRES